MLLQLLLNEGRLYFILSVGSSTLTGAAALSSHTNEGWSIKPKPDRNTEVLLDQSIWYSDNIFTNLFHGNAQWTLNPNLKILTQCTIPRFDELNRIQGQTATWRQSHNEPLPCCWGMLIRAGGEWPLELKAVTEMGQEEQVTLTLVWLLGVLYSLTPFVEKSRTSSLYPRILPLASDSLSSCKRAPEWF